MKGTVISFPSLHQGLVKRARERKRLFVKDKKEHLRDFFYLEYQNLIQLIKNIYTKQSAIMSKYINA